MATNSRISDILHEHTNNGIYTGGNNNRVQTYTLAVALGFAAGLRSTIPLAVLSWGSNQETASTTPLLSFMSSRGFKIFSTLAVVGEIIGDKLPATPSRLKPPVLTARLTSGALAGFALGRRFNQSPLISAVLGAAGAAAGSFAGYYYRVTLDQHTPVPDVVWALIEDGAALGLGFTVARANLDEAES